MKKIILSLLGFLAVFSTAAAEEKPFVIIIPSWNNIRWVERNLDSVLSQNYANFRVIYIDDASDDGTADFVESYIRQNELENKVTLIRNPVRKRAMENIYHSVWLCQPDEIVALVDGDDWLSHQEVLNILNTAYSNPEVWLTHGQFIYHPDELLRFGAEFSAECVANNDFRSATSFTSHLFTFYAGLFHQIRKEDLLYEGVFFPVCYDLAIMFPMFEMAGTHIQFIPDFSYVYNLWTGQNDHTLHYQQQLELDRFIRGLPKYSPLEALFSSE